MLDRMDKITEGIKREISMILQEKVNDPRLDGIAVTRAKVSRDLKYAKIYYLGYSDDERVKSDAEKALKKARRFIRSELAGRVSIKFIPELVFVEDKEEEMEEHMDRTFEVIEKELEEHGETEEGKEDE
ncbi:MAG: 30S ribosome-binding factor RbfA [Candidatus Omnitrophota bacterium]